MRDIKFRAFDKKLKKVLKVKEIDFDNRIVTLEISESAIKKIPFEDVELLQYTGVKDKNGKEVYDGDVFIHTGQKFEVIWYSTRFIGIDHKDYAITDGYCCYVDCQYKDGSSSIEVIGNVYDNPELSRKRI